ncbi:hypothetical protein ACWD0A_06040 [Streptomyces sp. NPDC002867]
MVINPNDLGPGLPRGTVRERPSLWHADEPARARTWEQLLRARDRTGLQPVLLVDDERRSIPWDLDLDEVLDDGPDHRAEADGLDPVEVLTALWDQVQAEDADDDEGTIAPFTRAWPGLASTRSIPRNPDVVAVGVVAGLLRGRWLHGRGAPWSPRPAAPTSSPRWAGTARATTRTRRR